MDRARLTQKSAEALHGAQTKALRHGHVGVDGGTCCWPCSTSTTRTRRRSREPKRTRRLAGEWSRRRPGPDRLAPAVTSPSCC